MGSARQVKGGGLGGTSTGPEENLLRYRAQSWVLPSSGLQEAGERPDSTCAIEVETLKHRPPHCRGAA